MLGRLCLRIIATVHLSLVTTAIVKESQASAEEYRAPEAVPAEWRNYAARLQGSFRDWLAADDKIVSSLGDVQGMSSRTIIVRAWIASGGTVERVEFSGIDERAAAALRSKLVGGDIGTPPPSDMLQPLNLKLSLGDKG
jgi:hypothetical protein